MRNFLDCEFIEDGKTIDLISIGIASDDDRFLYIVNRDCDFSKASDWVLENVLKPMGLDRTGFKNIGSLSSPNKRNSYSVSRPYSKIGAKVLNFLLPTSYSVKPELWSYYASYDWVAICQLWGAMIDLPEGLPMHCNDIKQECDRLGNPQLPAQINGFHNALHDAVWHKKCWEFLQDYDRKNPQQMN